MSKSMQKSQRPKARRVRDARGLGRKKPQAVRLDGRSFEAQGVPLPLDAGTPGAAGDALVRQALAEALGVDVAAIARSELLKRSVDARKKHAVRFMAAFAVELAPQAPLELRPAPGVRIGPASSPSPLRIPDLSAAAAHEGRVVVAGAGPAGLFCALYLAEAGFRPLVVERGADADARRQAIDGFSRGGLLDVRTNVQFGEGGAGMFSDGKLTTGTKSPHIRHVLEAFVDAGAPDDILWQARPHLGTDKLPGIVKALRQRIARAGGEVRFLTRLAGIDLVDGAVARVSLEDVRTGECEAIDASRVVIACGHSARDAFEMLRDAGAALDRKPFSIGARIEHSQKAINQAQYGRAAGHTALGAADYKLAVHVPEADGASRGVYTFCMCPGGEVVAAASEEGGVVVNGASRYARDGKNANSALLADVRPGDLPGDDVLAGLELQRQVEQTAYRMVVEQGGKPYAAPAQTVGSFLGTKPDAKPDVKPSYPRGVAYCDLHELLPPFVSCALEQGLPLLGKKLAGFDAPGAVLTAPETRSSSPVRILRGADFQARFAPQGFAGRCLPEGFSREDAPRIAGLYPCGEGAGYAGGIMSAAVDGLRVAEAIAAECGGGAALSAAERQQEGE